MTLFPRRSLICSTPYNLSARFLLRQKQPVAVCKVNTNSRGTKHASTCSAGFLFIYQPSSFYAIPSFLRAGKFTIFPIKYPPAISIGMDSAAGDIHSAPVRNRMLSRSEHMGMRRIVYFSLGSPINRVTARISAAKKYRSCMCGSKNGIQNKENSAVHSNASPFSSMFLYQTYPGTARAAMAAAKIPQPAKNEFS